MLGGEGEPLDKVREFSEIELLIIERIMTACVQLLREPWTNVLDVHPRLERIETNSPVCADHFSIGNDRDCDDRASRSGMWKVL